MSNQKDVQNSLKEALFETLNGILSPHSETRQAAEQRIKALEVTDDFGIHLTEFVVDKNGFLPIRQLSSVLLKQYVETHWCPESEKFRAPELKQATKEKIKELLPLGLHESISKVRSAVAYAISAIAHWDWPENWPGLFNILVDCLTGQNEYAVHGAMRVLSEFTRDLTDTQLPNVGPVILEEMYRIFQSETQYSKRTRGKAVEIFSTITGLVASTGIYQKEFIERYLQPVVPMFCEQFIKTLSQPNGPTSDVGLITDIIKAITSLVTKLPKSIGNFLPQILPPIWDIFVHSAKLYQEETIIAESSIDDDAVDSDGEIVNFFHLIIATFEFISNLIENERFRSLLENLSQEAMYYLMIFMQITDEQVESWTANPSQFLEEDEQYAFAYNVRISAQELLTAFVGLNDGSVGAVCEVITRHIEAANALSVTNKDSWKLCESAILSLSLSKNSLIRKLEAGTLQFDLVGFLDRVILRILNDSTAHPFLLARCLCLGGIYAKQIPSEMIPRFMEATINGLAENQPTCIRISSTRAAYWFCEAAVQNPSLPLGNLIRPYLAPIFQGQFAFITTYHSTEVVNLVMETFGLLITIDPEFTASIETKICPLTIAIFIKYYADPDILGLCEDIFKALSENPQCIGPLQTRLVPTIVSMMAVDPQDKTKDDAIRSVALDILQVLVQYSPGSLSSMLMETAFPAACHCILNSDDNATLQSGGEVIRTYLAVGARQVIDHRDNEGRTGLQFILQIIGQLLNPQSSEFTATFIGRLITTLIRTVGRSLGENLDLLLKAILSKMQRAESLTVMQSLLMVYAHLINSEFDAVLQFLSTVPGPSGQSALAFVLEEWVDRQNLFFGIYDRKLTIVALSKILEHGVTNDDARLNEIMVKGDQIFANEEGRKTRSKTKTQPFQWTKVPILVKIFKLIINELGDAIEAARCPSPDAFHPSTCSGSEDEDDADDVNFIDPGVTLKAMMHAANNDWKDAEDPELQHDSIYQLNLTQYLRDFLNNFSSHHCFPAFIQHLTPIEQEVLSQIHANPTFHQ